MKILFVSPFLPYPPVAGGHAQIWGWMTRLSQRHELAFVGFYEREPERENVTEVEKVCVEMHARLRQPTPHAYCSFAQVPQWVSEYYSDALAADLAVACERFRPDVIQFLSTNMAQYRRVIGTRPVVVTALEISFVAHARRIPTVTGFERLRAQAEYARMLRFETAQFQHATHVITMSESDTRIVQAVAPQTPVTAVPPGIGPEALAPRPRHPQPGSVLYFGHMEHFPNLDGLLYLYKDIWPLIQQQFPQARLTIAGRGTREELTRLAPEVLTAMEGDASVTLAGFVLDLRALLDTHAVMAVPIRLGGGVRNKVIEALAAGLPTVTTARGAEGLEVQSERELLVADDPTAFACKVVRLFTEEELSSRLAEVGRALVARAHDNDMLAKRLEAALFSAQGADV